MTTMIINFFYFTATVLNWKHILKADKYKDVLINSFRFLVKEERVRIFAFVIMPNHFHAVWKINENLEKPDYQRDLMKFTGQTILRDLKQNQIEIYNSLYVGAIRHGGQASSVLGKKSSFSSFIYTESSRAKNKLYSCKSCSS